MEAITVPADYCYNVDPPHPKLTPNCTITSTSPPSYVNNNMYMYIAISLFIILLISSSVFFMIKK